MILVRVLFRVDVKEEVAQFEKSQRSGGQPIERLNLRVDNANLDGLRIDAIPGLHETEVTVSRLKRRGESEVHVATGASVIHTGDTLLTVGTAPHLESFQRIVGARSDEDLMKAPGQVTFKRVIVTNKPVLGKTVRQLGLEAKHGVSVTRLQRGGVEMMATADVRLQFGDVLIIVGDARALEQVAAELGNSPKQLGETNFIPVFFGIVLGIIAGSLPIALPGLPVPVRLGLAGGPLVLAILLARVGNIGRLVWYMPGNVNYAFRELGIILFLACVGLKVGFAVRQHPPIAERSALVGLRRRDHHRPDPGSRHLRQGGAQAELHDNPWFAGRQHDGSPCARLRQHNRGIACAGDFLRLRLSVDHASPHHCGTGASHSAGWIICS